MTARSDFSDPAPTPEVLLSDKQLLERYEAGQRDAGEKLFNRYHEPAYRVAYRLLNNEADAWDAVQDACVKVLTHFHSFQMRSSFKTWLLRIVANAALEFGRKRSRAPRPLTDKEEPACDACRHRTKTPLDDLAERELPEVIRRILKQYATDRRRQVYEMWDRDLSHAQIAEQLGLSVSMVGKEKQRITAILREKLSDLGWSTF
jgi:RNA polymerase sigma-70 factor (ECF subfamily)